MENVTYYFASNKNNEELTKLISDPLFTRIVDYLSEHNEQEVILRQIKAAIQTDGNLELYLDKLIKYNLLERKNRRYALTFPIYIKGEFLQLPNSIDGIFQEITQEASIQTEYFLFGEWLWSLLFQEAQDNYFFGVKTFSDRLPTFRRIEEGNGALSFVSVHPDYLIPLDLANYFNLLSRRQELPEKFKLLQNTIGDVDINYFIPQIQKVLRSVKRNKVRENKRNIFQEALLVTGDLKKNEDNQFHLATPIIENNSPSEPFQHILDKLEMALIPLWEKIESKNERIFYKQQLYSFIVATYFPKGEGGITYFKR